MKTIFEIDSIVNQINYKKDWNVCVHMTNLDERKPYLQIEFMGEDVETGIVELQKCRKWNLSYHMTDTEIVNTAFKAIQAAEDHETREFFTYKNVRTHNPHFSVNDIVDMVNNNKLTEDVRDNVTN